MKKVPFHRRVFFWVIIVAFFILAPAVVFYTSGYRWNAKKGMIERNGTLILDTRPPGATVSLNGETIPSRTPVTMQNTTPGTYRIRLEFPGYATWEKTLDVRASRVTFVNDVRLWRNGTPTRAWDRETAAIASSPNGRVLATVEKENTTTRLAFRDISSGGDVSPDVNLTGTDTLLFTGVAPTGTVRLLWNDASDAVIVSDDSGHEWLADRAGNSTNALLLPVGNWRWAGAELVGIRSVKNADGSTRAERSEIAPRTGIAQLAALPLNVVDQEGSSSVVTATDTARLYVEDRGRSDQRFELPPGNWMIAKKEGSWLFLTDGNEWLGFNPGDAESPAMRVPAGQSPVFLTRGRETALLSFDRGELWEGVLGKTSELLLRASDSIVNAAWHREGSYVFYATAHDLVVLGLDARDGRTRNTLAAFDRIYGFTVTERFVYIAATRDGDSGVWRLEVE